MLRAGRSDTVRNMKALIIYHTKTGHTRRAAEDISEGLRSEGVDVTIPGVASVSEVDENVTVASGPTVLTDEELALIEGDKAELGDRFCRACGYCQPCPQGIPITSVLRAESQFLKRMGWRPGTEERFAGYVEKARTCIECGACEERCPYNLPVRELLPEAANSLEKLLETRR